MTYPLSSLIRAVLIAAAVAAGSSGAARAEDIPNDFPTEARADYVYGCMKANGETQDALHRCSCSVDVIATIISYDTYEKASTFISLGQMTGDNGSLFRNAKESKNVVGELKRAQAEAEMRCF